MSQAIALRRRAALFPATFLVGTAMGALTAIGQSALPEQIRSAANSAGSWSLVAFALALRATDARRAMWVGATALAAMLLGYVILDQARGFPSSHQLILMWITAAVLAGPALGLAAYLLRSGSKTHASLATGGLSGLLIGEGLYGLTVIRSSTSATYWLIEISAGLLVLVGASSRRLKTWPSIALASVVTAGFAVAFISLYALA